MYTFRFAPAVLILLIPTLNAFAIDHFEDGFKATTATVLMESFDREHLNDEWDVSQRTAAMRLYLATSGRIQVQVRSGSNEVLVVSGIDHLCSTRDPWNALAEFDEHLWAEIRQVFGVGMGDEFSTSLVAGEGADASPSPSYTFVRTRLHRGIEVDGDQIHVNIVRNHPENPEGLTVTGVSGRFDPMLRQDIPLGQSLPPELAIAHAADTLRKTVVAGPERLLISRVNGEYRSVYRVDASVDGSPHRMDVDATSGEIVIDQEFPQAKYGYVKIGATNPNEYYNPAVGKTLHPLPRGNFYRGVVGAPWRGNSSVLHGATDYHGYFNLPTVSSDGSICSDCWAVDFITEGTSTTYFEDVTQQFYPDLLFYAWILNVLGSPDGSTYQIPYLNLSFTNLRHEAFYHLNYVRYFLQDYFGMNVRRTRFGIFPLLDCENCNRDCSSHCGTGSMGFDNDGFALINFLCGQHAGNPAEMTDAGEADTRDTFYHEMGHVFVASFPNYFGESALDFPKRERVEAFDSNFAVFLPGLVSSFQSEVGSDHLGAAVNTALGRENTYPSDYSCDNEQDAVPFLNIWNDLVLYAGTVGIKTILWHMLLPDQYTRLLDCANVASVQQCTNPNTYYLHMLTKANLPWNAHWQNVFEVSKAFHSRITDAVPGLVCDSSGNAVVTDTTVDTFPFGDDTTNITFLAPFIHMDSIADTSFYSENSTPWAVLKYGPDTCATTSATSCKRLALDHTWDYDKWSLVGKAGATYIVTTSNVSTTTPLTDTKMEIRDKNGNSISRCGTSGTANCYNDDCAQCPAGSNSLCSCLTFKPTTTDVYRLYIYPYHSSSYNSRVGADAVYSVEISQTLDDHANDYTGSTPTPADGAWRFAFMNPSVPADQDWYFLVLPTAGNLAVSACLGSSNLTVTLYNGARTPIRTFTPANCSALDSVSLAAGVYYARFHSPSASTGIYFYRFSSTTDVGNTRSTSLDLDSATFPWPNAVRAVPQILGSNDIDVYRFFAAKGEFIELEAIASMVGDVEPQLILERPDENPTEMIGFMTAAPTECVNGVQRVHAVRLDYILADAQGGVVRADNEIQRHARISFVTPRDGWYFARVVNEGSGSGGYTFYCYRNGSRLSDYPPLP